MNKVLRNTSMIFKTDEFFKEDLYNLKRSATRFIKILNYAECDDLEDVLKTL